MFCVSDLCLLFLMILIFTYMLISFIKYGYKDIPDCDDDCMCSNCSLKKICWDYPIKTNEKCSDYEKEQKE